MSDIPRSATVLARRLHAASPITRLLNGMLAPAARKRGFAEAALIADWPSVVGRAMARRCHPERIAFRPGSRRQGVLVLRAPGAMALELQHAAPQIIERINAYMGFAAIRKITLVQGPLPLVPIESEPPEAPLDAGAEAEVEAGVADVASADLKAALASLGRTVKRRDAARSNGKRQAGEDGHGRSD